MKFKLEHHKKYEAVISLGFFERIATNKQIAEKLVDAGFVGVSIYGAGKTRHAEGTWQGPDREVELPSQVSGVKELAS